MSFGYKCVGQFQDQEDINNWAIQDDAGNTTMMPGDLKYEDFNGDGVMIITIFNQLPVATRQKFISVWT